MKKLIACALLLAVQISAKSIELAPGRQVPLPINKELQIGAATWLPGAETYFLDLPVGADRVAILLDSTQHLNPAVTVVFSTRISFDNRQTWTVGPSVTRVGGVFSNDGVIETSFRMILTDIGQPTNQNRWIEVSRQITGGSFISAGGTILASKTTVQAKDAR